MKPFIVVDRFLLNRVEKLSHSLQKTFGLGCHKWAQLCYGAFIANTIRWVADNLLRHKIGWWWLSYFPLYLFVYLYLMPEVEKLHQWFNENGYSNPRKCRTSSIIGRLANFVFIAFYAALGLYSWMFSFVLITLSDYFESCDDLPPGKSRVRKFVDAIRAFGMKPVSVNQ